MHVSQSTVGSATIPNRVDDFRNPQESLLELKNHTVILYSGIVTGQNHVDKNPELWTPHSLRIRPSVYRHTDNHLMICSMYRNTVVLLFVEMVRIKVVSIAKVTGPCLFPVTGSTEITCWFVIIIIIIENSCIVCAFLCS